MSRPALPGRILCLVTDRSLTGDIDSLVKAVDAAVAAGANMVQMREKGLSRDDLAALAMRLRDVTSARALLIVNGDPEIAVEAQAEGVQLAEGTMNVADARQIVGTERLIGRSVHSLDGAVRAEEEGADFVVVGTVFPSRSHPGGQAAGTELIRAVSSAVQIPVIGIGGITAKNAASVIEAGAAGVAVISAILASPDPAAATRELSKAIAR